MNDGAGPDEILTAECVHFCRYLVNRAPDEAILRTWRRAQAHLPAHPHDTDTRDQWLLRLGRQGGVPLRLADAWARLLCPGTLLRRKLILAAAVCESSRGTAPLMHTGPVTPGWRALAGIVGAGLALAGWTIMALLLLGPVHLLRYRTRTIHRV